MQCHNCSWLEKPAEVRRDHCIACSTDQYKRNRFNTNELSNKGKTFISFDNHNAEMTDDRDVCAGVSKAYLRSRTNSAAGTPHPSKAISKHIGINIPEQAYEFVKRFLFEMYSLTEMQELLIRALILGVSSTDFAAAHGIKPAAVRQNLKIIAAKSPIVAAYIKFTTGSNRLFNCGRRPAKRTQPVNLALGAKASRKVIKFAPQQLNLFE